MVINLHTIILTICIISYKKFDRVTQVVHECAHEYEHEYGGVLEKILGRYVLPRFS